MFPSLISISLTWFVPESPRWLIAKGKVERARKILVEYHCGGDETDPLASFEVHEIESTLAFEKENSNGSWLQLFRTKGNRWRTWVVGSCAFVTQSTGTTLIGYYLVVVLTGVGVTDPRTQSIINGCLTLWNMGWAFWGAYVIDKFGRRPMMLTSLTGQLLFGFLPWTICNAIYTTRGDQAAGHAVIAFIFIASAFYATTWNGILTGYTVECMSYDVRSKLVVTQNFLVQGSITMWNYVNPIAIEHISWVSQMLIENLRNTPLLAETFANAITSWFLEVLHCHRCYHRTVYHSGVLHLSRDFAHHTRRSQHHLRWQECRKERFVGEDRNGRW